MGRAQRDIPGTAYSVNGERRSFALFGPQPTPPRRNRVRELILQAYQEYESAAAIAP